MRGDPVKEPAIVRDQHGASRKAEQRVLQCPEGVDVEVVRGLVEQQQVAAAAQQLRKVLADRALTTVFQPIFGFREGRVLGYEALVRGPQGSLIQTPGELFAAATQEGVSAELNLLCIQEILRAFSERELSDESSAALPSAASAKSTLTRIGRSAGPPWRADERLAATAAWIAMAI